MNLTIDDLELTEFIKDQTERLRGLQVDLYDAVLNGSLGVEQKVKELMPVETGRARASWATFDPGLLVPVPTVVEPGVRYLTIPKALTGAPQEANASDAIWEDHGEELVIEQGTRVEYVEKLEGGSSIKAQAGFIERTAESGGRYLEENGEKVLSNIDRKVIDFTEFTHSEPGTGEVPF